MYTAKGPSGTRTYGRFWHVVGEPRGIEHTGEIDSFSTAGREWSVQGGLHGRLTGFGTVWHCFALFGTCLALFGTVLTSELTRIDQN